MVWNFFVKLSKKITNSAVWAWLKIGWRKLQVNLRNFRKNELITWFFFILLVSFSKKITNSAVRVWLERGWQTLQNFQITESIKWLIFILYLLSPYLFPTRKKDNVWTSNSARLKLDLRVYYYIYGLTLYPLVNTIIFRTVLKYGDQDLERAEVEVFDLGEIEGTRFVERNLPLFSKTAKALQTARIAVQLRLIAAYETQRPENLQDLVQVAFWSGARDRLQEYYDANEDLLANFIE
uniref:Uncharacterized protein n=1 Tax=Lobelia laxa TaxID=2041130 RepID=A0A291EYU6_9ASTR|nr:hypothetical protein Lo_lxa1Pt0564 [Lobelia laxa]ATG25057.1 hypothetical protein Lo_lxa1Pt0564 [Lobelia laxa]